VVNGTELRVFRKEDGSWIEVNRVNASQVLGKPEKPYIVSPEPFTHGDKPYIAFQLSEAFLSVDNAIADIYIMQPQATTSCHFRMISPDNTAARRKPEPFALQDKAVVYFSEGEAGTRNLFQADTGLDTLTPETDLGITKTDSADPVIPGDPLTYTLTITNAGPSDASSVTVVDTLPSAVTFVSSNPPAPTCDLAGATLTCALGALAAGGNATVTIDVTVNDDATDVIVNTASVSGDETDPNPVNNSASEPTGIGGAATPNVDGSYVPPGWHYWRALLTTGMYGYKASQWDVGSAAPLSS
jgi:uncharacterized repeat protein (TIGR01451 family)